MTPPLLQSLENSIISAQHFPDPIVWAEAARRFEVLDREIGNLAESERVRLQERLYRLLPSDWPLWMELCRCSHEDLALH